MYLTTNFALMKGALPLCLENIVILVPRFLHLQSTTCSTFSILFSILDGSESNNSCVLKREFFVCF